MTKRIAIDKLVLWSLLALLMAAPHGCRCGEDPQVPESAPTGVAGLPETYPTDAADAADALAGLLPAETDAAIFVASYASLVELTDVVKTWGLVDADEMEGIFSSLERYHGLNPGKAQSYVDNGLPLAGQLVIGRLEGSWFLISEVADREKFEVFLDGLINEEYGRPRPQTREREGVEITEIRVLKRDLLSMAWRDDVVVIVAGERVVAESGASVDVLGRLLATESANALSAQPAFAAMSERLGGEGSMMLFTSEGELALDLLGPVLSTNEALGKRLGDLLGERLEGFGMVADADERGLRRRSFASLPQDALTSTLEVVTPADEGAQAELTRLAGADVRGLARLTFDPKAAEAQILAMLDKKQVDAWNKLKGQLKIRFVFNFEEEILYNLAGEALLALYQVDEDSLTPEDNFTDVLLEGARAAVFLPMADKDMANGVFNKLDSLKGLLSGFLPPGQVEFGQRDGVLVITVNRRGEALLHVAYHDGVLAASSGDDETLDRVVARLKSNAAGASVPSGYEALLSPGAVWGVVLDVSEIVELLSARYEVVRGQIQRFLAPLSRVALRVGFEPTGIGLDLSVTMGRRPTDDTAEGSDDDVPADDE